MNKKLAIVIVLLSVTTGCTSSQYSGKLSFSGKLVNKETNEWLNNRLVVLYLKGEEIGRTTTGIGATNLSGEGSTDGFFKILVPNTYLIPHYSDIFHNYDYAKDYDFGERQVQADHSLDSLNIFSVESSHFPGLRPKMRRLQRSSNIDNFLSMLIPLAPIMNWKQEENWRAISVWLGPIW